MLGIANTNVRGVYIFGGAANTTEPFIGETGGIRYAGSDENTLALLGSLSETAKTQRIGLTGDEVFGALPARCRATRTSRPPSPTLRD